MTGALKLSSCRSCDATNDAACSHVTKCATCRLEEAMKPRRHRTQLDLSPAGFERLRHIRMATDAATNAEVVQRALRLLEWYLNERALGRRVQTVDDAQHTIELEMLR